MLTGKCSLVKRETKQPLLLLSFILRREKHATRQFLRVAGLVQMGAKMTAATVAKTGTLHLMSLKVDALLSLIPEHLINLKKLMLNTSRKINILASKC